MSNTRDVWAGYLFGLEIEGIQEGFFSECSPPEAKVEVLDFQEGGVNDFVHKLPGRRSFTNLTLKRPMSTGTGLWDWLDRVATSSAKGKESKSISVVLFTPAGKPAVRWNFTGAFPVKWSGPGLNSTQSQAMVETLEIAFQELTVQEA